MSVSINNQSPVDVSIIQLIANPQAYHKRHIRIIGFARLQFESNAVYLHQDDCRVAISKNGLWLRLTRDQQQSYREYDQKYILIEGTFDANDMGHRGLFSGAVKDIRRLEEWIK